MRGCDFGDFSNDSRGARFHFNDVNSQSHAITWHIRPYHMQSEQYPLPPATRADQFLSATCMSIGWRGHADKSTPTPHFEASTSKFTPSVDARGFVLHCIGEPEGSDTDSVESTPSRVATPSLPPPARPLTWMFTLTVHQFLTST